MSSLAEVSATLVTFSFLIETTGFILNSLVLSYSIESRSGELSEPKTFKFLFFGVETLIRTSFLRSDSTGTSKFDIPYYARR